MSQTPDRILPDYEHDEMMKYGQCTVCGGPRTSHLWAEGKFGDPDFNMRMDMRCLWCGGYAT